MAITYATLDATYPIEQSPCSTNGAPNHENQCAIRVGICLAGAGVPLGSFGGARCWSGHSRDHTLRAEELATWLINPTRVRLFKDGVFTRTLRPRNATIGASSYADRKGIALFKNFWGTGNQGDHIDL